MPHMGRVRSGRGLYVHEERCIQGKGHFSAGHIMRNLANNSNWWELFLAIADRFDELEAKIKELEK